MKKNDYLLLITKIFDDLVDFDRHDNLVEYPHADCYYGAYGNNLYFHRGGWFSFQVRLLEGDSFSSQGFIPTIKTFFSRSKRILNKLEGKVRGQYFFIQNPVCYCVDQKVLNDCADCLILLKGNILFVNKCNKFKNLDRISFYNYYKSAVIRLKLNEWIYFYKHNLDQINLIELFNPNLLEMNVFEFIWDFKSINDTNFTINFINYFQNNSLIDFKLLFNDSFSFTVIGEFSLCINNCYRVIDLVSDVRNFILNNLPSKLRYFLKADKNLLIEKLIKYPNDNFVSVILGGDCEIVED